MINLVETSPQVAQDLMKKGNLTSSVIGLGHAGLDLAISLSRAGARVIGVDSDLRKINIMRNGKCPINIPFLKKRFEELVRSGTSFEVLSGIEDAVTRAEVIFIVVPTPLTSEKRPDLSVLRSVTRDVGRALKRGKLVIVESTVYPMTMKKTVLPILETESGLRVEVDFLLAHCPERIDPGNETHRLDNTPRVVGGIGPISAEMTVALYGAFIEANIQGVTSCETAELTKLLENVYRDVNIALINEIALLAERLGIDFLEAVTAASTKWSFQPHFPGAGVGGSCIPVSPYYLLEISRQHGIDLKIVKAAREVNESMPSHVVDLIKEALAETGREIEGSKIALLGIPYKPGVDDVRGSPTEEILNSLKNMGAVISCYDPLVLNPSETFASVFHRSLQDALRNANCVVVTTAQEEFKKLSPTKLLDLAGSTGLAVVDGRNVFSPRNFTQSGIIFKGIGRTAGSLLSLAEVRLDDKDA